MNRHSVRRIALAGVAAVGFVSSVYAAGEAANRCPGRASEGPLRSARQAAGLGRHLDHQLPDARREARNTPAQGQVPYRLSGLEEGLAGARRPRQRRRPPTARRPACPTSCRVGQYPIEFMFTPGRVTTHHEAWMQWRVIYTDGRPHADIEPSFNGDSIGHWEGDTLVVDTVNIKTTVPLGPGMFHSDKVHIVERIHLDPKNADTLARTDDGG